LTFDLCDAKAWKIDDRYKNQFMIDTINSLYCVNQKELESIVLEGNYFATQFSYMEINLNICSNKPECAKPAEI
jgi:hypothetical protein